MRSLKKFALAVMLTGSLGGCGTLPQIEEFSADPAAASHISVEEAQETLKNAKGTLCFGVICGAFNSDIAGIELSSDNQTLVFVESDGDRSHMLPVKSLSIKGKAVADSGWVYFTADESLYIATTRAAAMQIADAAMAIKQAPSAEQKRAAFEAVAKSYHEAAVKPVLGEDARRYKVQAEAAIREKRFADAVAAYGKALDIAPWWPDGHYNRALILAELGKFAQAARELKQYLILVPNAPDARAAQDKIYEWEGKAGTSN
jgi:hypothetical protein